MAHDWAASATGKTKMAIATKIMSECEFTFKLGTMKVLLYSDRCSINFNPFFSHLFPYMGEIRCNRLTHITALPLGVS